MEEDMEWSLRSGWKTRDGNLAKHVSLLQVLHAADGSVLRKQADLPDEDGVGGGAILVPGPDPSPCEVTVKFQHRLCHIHCIQVLSSAKTCEIYTQSEGAANPEYVCTRRGMKFEAATKSKKIVAGMVDEEISSKLSVKEPITEDRFESHSNSQGAEDAVTSGMTQEHQRSEIQQPAESANVAGLSSGSEDSDCQETEGELAVCECGDMPICKCKVITGIGLAEPAWSQQCDVQHGSHFSCETDEEERSCSEDSTDWAEAFAHSCKSQGQEVDELQSEGCKAEFYLVDSADGSGSHCQQEFAESYSAGIHKGLGDEVISLIKHTQGGVHEADSDAIQGPVQDSGISVVGLGGGEKSEVVQASVLVVDEWDGQRNGTVHSDEEFEVLESSNGLVSSCKGAGFEQQIVIKNEKRHDVNSFPVDIDSEEEVLSDRILYKVEVQFEDLDPCMSLTIRLLSLEEKFVVDIEDVLITMSLGPIFTAFNCSTSVNPPQQGLNVGNGAAFLGMLVPSMLRMTSGLSGSSERKEVAPAASINGEKLLTEGASMQSMLTPSKEPIMQALMSRLDPGGLKGKHVADSPAVEVTHNASVAEVCQRLDRLEAVCVRIETSLNKALESFDRRIELLEARQNVGQPGNVSCTGSSPIAYESRFAPGLEAQVSNPYSTHTSGQGRSIFEESSASLDVDKVLDRSAVVTKTDDTVSSQSLEEAHHDGAESSGKVSSSRMISLKSSRPLVTVDDAWSSALLAFSMTGGSIIAGAHPGSIGLNTDQLDTVSSSETLTSELRAGATEEPMTCLDSNIDDEKDVTSSVNMSFLHRAAIVQEGASDDPVGRKEEEDSDGDELVKVANQPEETAQVARQELQTQQHDVQLIHDEDAGAGQEEEILLRPVEVSLNYGLEDNLAQVHGSATRASISHVQMKEPTSVSDLYKFFVDHSTREGSSSGSKSPWAFDLNCLYEEQEEDCRPHSRQVDFRSGNLHVSTFCPSRHEYCGVSTRAASSESTEQLMHSEHSQKWVEQQQPDHSLEDLFASFSSSSVLEIGDYQAGVEGSWFSMSSSHREELALSNEIDVHEQFWASEAISGLSHQQQFMDLVTEDLEYRTAKPSSEGFQEVFGNFVENAPSSRCSDSTQSGEHWPIHLESHEFLSQRYSSAQADLFEAFSQRDALEEEEGDTGLLLDDMTCFSVVTSQVSSGVTSSATSVPLMTVDRSDSDPFKDLFVDEAARPSFPSNNDLFMSLSSEIVRAGKEPLISRPSVSDPDPLELLSANQAMALGTYDFPRNSLHTEGFFSLPSLVVPQAAAVAQGLPLEPTRLPELLWDSDSYGSGSPSTTRAPDSQYTGDVSSDVSFEGDAASPFCSLEPVRLDPGASLMEGMGLVDPLESEEMIWYSV